METQESSHKSFSYIDFVIGTLRDVSDLQGESIVNSEDLEKEGHSQNKFEAVEYDDLVDEETYQTFYTYSTERMHLSSTPENSKKTFKNYGNKVIKRIRKARIKSQQGKGGRDAKASGLQRFKQCGKRVLWQIQQNRRMRNSQKQKVYGGHSINLQGSGCLKLNGKIHNLGLNVNTVTIDEVIALYLQAFTKYSVEKTINSVNWSEYPIELWHFDPVSKQRKKILGNIYLRQLLKRWISNSPIRARASIRLVLHDFISSIETLDMEEILSSGIGLWQLSIGKENWLDELNNMHIKKRLPRAFASALGKCDSNDFAVRTSISGAIWSISIHSDLLTTSQLIQSLINSVQNTFEFGKCFRDDNDAGTVAKTEGSANKDTEETGKDIDSTEKIDNEQAEPTDDLNLRKAKYDTCRMMQMGALFALSVYDTSKLGTQGCLQCLVDTVNFDCKRAGDIAIKIMCSGINVLRSYFGMVKGMKQLVETLVAKIEQSSYQFQLSAVPLIVLANIGANTKRESDFLEEFCSHRTLKSFIEIGEAGFAIQESLRGSSRRIDVKVRMNIVQAALRAVSMGIKAWSTLSLKHTEGLQMLGGPLLKLLHKLVTYARDQQDELMSTYALMTIHVYSCEHNQIDLRSEEVALALVKRIRLTKYPNVMKTILQFERNEKCRESLQGAKILRALLLILKSSCDERTKKRLGDEAFIGVKTQEIVLKTMLDFAFESINSSSSIQPNTAETIFDLAVNSAIPEITRKSLLCVMFSICMNKESVRSLASSSTSYTRMITLLRMFATDFKHHYFELSLTVLWHMLDAGTEEAEQIINDQNGTIVNTIIAHCIGNLHSFRRTFGEHSGMQPKSESLSQNASVLNVVFEHAINMWVVISYKRSLLESEKGIPSAVRGTSGIVGFYDAREDAILAFTDFEQKADISRRRHVEVNDKRKSSLRRNMKQSTSTPILAPIPTKTQETSSEDMIEEGMQLVKERRKIVKNKIASVCLVRTRLLISILWYLIDKNPEISTKFVLSTEVIASLFFVGLSKRVQCVESKKLAAKLLWLVLFPEETNESTSDKREGDGFDFYANEERDYQKRTILGKPKYYYVSRFVYLLCNFAETSDASLQEVSAVLLNKLSTYLSETEVIKRDTIGAIAKVGGIDSLNKLLKISSPGSRTKLYAAHTLKILSSNSIQQNIMSNNGGFKTILDVALTEVTELQNTDDSSDERYANWMKTQSIVRDILTILRKNPCNATRFYRAEMRGIKMPWETRDSKGLQKKYSFSPSVGRVRFSKNRHRKNTCVIELNPDFFSEAREDLEESSEASEAETVKEEELDKDIQSDAELQKEKEITSNVISAWSSPAPAMTAFEKRILKMRQKEEEELKETEAEEQPESEEELEEVFEPIGGPVFYFEDPDSETILSSNKDDFWHKSLFKFEKIPGSTMLQDLPVFEAPDGSVFHLCLKSSDPQSQIEISHDPLLPPIPTGVEELFRMFSDQYIPGDYINVMYGMLGLSKIHAPEHENDSRSIPLQLLCPKPPAPENVAYGYDTTLKPTHPLLGQYGYCLGQILEPCYPTFFCVVKQLKNLPSGNASTMQSVWSVTESIFGASLKDLELNSVFEVKPDAFWDTARKDRAIIRKDFQILRKKETFRTLIKQDGSAVLNSLCRFASLLLGLFKFYSNCQDYPDCKPFIIGSAQEFRNFVKDSFASKINSDQQLKEDQQAFLECDQIYKIATDRPSDEEDENSWGNMNGMLRHEFFEALIRLASVEHEEVAPALALSIFISEYIILAFGKETLLDGNKFRLESLYNQEVNVILMEKYKVLFQIYDSFAGKAEHSKDTGGMETPPRLSIYDWQEMVKQFGLFEFGNTTVRDCRIVYALSLFNESDIDKNYRFAVSMSFHRFLEAICRLAQVVFIPSALDLKKSEKKSIIEFYEAANQSEGFERERLKEHKLLNKDNVQLKVWNRGELYEGDGRTLADTLPSFIELIQYKYFLLQE